jgi:NTP pyrophosphatase (non-canonical NTP hydrolase)
MTDPEVTVSAEVAQQPEMPTQADVLAWVARRWPNRTTPIWRAGKLCEEAGEVMGAVIKVVGFDLWRAVADEYERCQP